MSSCLSIFKNVVHILMYVLVVEHSKSIRRYLLTKTDILKGLKGGVSLRGVFVVTFDFFQTLNMSYTRSYLLKTKIWQGQIPKIDRSHLNNYDVIICE